MTTASRLAAAAPFLAAAICVGQICTDQWLPGPGLPGIDREPNAMIVFDFDGPGPRQPELVVGGYSIEVAGSVRSQCIAIWNGTDWHPLNGNATRAFAFTTWDADGAGPEPVRLVASGEFDGVDSVAYWDGETWQLIGQPAELPLSVTALATYDPDGPGSALPRLIATGSSGYSSGRVIVQWDGAHWVGLGAPFASPYAPEIRALTTFDPDDAGPAPLELIAGGQFSTAGGVAANGIAAWNGSTWRPLNPSVGPATVASIYALTTWDPDGAGPFLSRLIAVGGVSAPSTGSWPVASWDGSAWSPVGGAFTQYALVRAVSTFDPDGAGPAHDLLIAFGNFFDAGGVPVRNIASWDGTEWRALGDGVRVMSGNSPVSLATFDPDGAGLQPDRLIAGGQFTQAGNIGAVNIASWDGLAWSSLGGGFNQGIEAMAIFDPDGDGPAPPELYAGGRFIRTPDGPARGLARWDGAHWHALSSELSAPYDVRVTDFTLWDPDGTGPAAELLVVVGWFTSAGGLPANGIVAWDGAAWRSVGDPAMGVTAVTSWDPDGLGPILPRLVAAGFYDYGRVKQWDGAAWQQLGGGIYYVEPNYVLNLNSLASHDPDGPGPATPELFLGGSFDTIGTSTIRTIARWDGTAWVRVFDDIYGDCAALCTFDFDGPGPLPERLAAAGEFSSNGSSARLLVRTGTTWSPFPNTDFSPRLISPFDPDGAGPRPTRLVVGGRGSLTPSGYYPNIYWWDDAGFEPFNPGIRGFFYPGPSVAALAVLQPVGEPPRLAAGGYFNSAGDHVSSAFAIWTCAPAAPCYPNCDGSAAPPILNVNDFICFMNRFAKGDAYANCDASTALPTLNVQDFICFADRFSAGCP